MTIATRPTERRSLAPVQRRAENHMTIGLTFDQAERDNSVQLRLLTAEDQIDSMAEIRRVALVNDMYEALAVMQSYCEEDGSRSAFENLNACIRAYVAFEQQDEKHEDENRDVLLGAIAREVKTYRSARTFARKITPDCTGEHPDPAA